MMCVCFVVFFFFKQKTAYEMRISDWSSDVCSSDLTDGSGHFSIGSAAKQHKRYQQIYRHQHRDRQMPCTNDEQANGHNGYRDKRISGQSGSERLEHVDMVGPANITDPERCDKEPSGQAANAISRDEQRHEQQQCCGCKNPKSERWGETFCCFVHAVMRSGDRKSTRLNSSH